MTELLTTTYTHNELFVRGRLYILLQLALGFSYRVFEKWGLIENQLILATFFTWAVLLSAPVLDPYFRALFKKYKSFTFGTIGIFILIAVLPAIFSYFAINPILEFISWLMLALGLIISVFFYNIFLSHEKFKNIGWHTQDQILLNPKTTAVTSKLGNKIAILLLMLILLVAIVITFLQITKT